MTPDQTTPLVSVGIPVYNGERHIAIAIESILSQTLRDLELIISDNASTDNTEDLQRICDQRFAGALLSKRSEPRRLMEPQSPCGTSQGRIFQVAVSR